MLILITFHEISGIEDELFERVEAIMGELGYNFQIDTDDEGNRHWVLDETQETKPISINVVFDGSEEEDEEDSNDEDNEDGDEEVTEIDGVEVESLGEYSSREDLINKIKEKSNSLYNELKNNEDIKSPIKSNELLSDNRIKEIENYITNNNFMDQFVSNESYTSMDDETAMEVLKEIRNLNTRREKIIGIINLLLSYIKTPDVEKEILSILQDDKSK